jgi:uncharacterized membrane protein YcaP (DUF421 family)
MQALHKSRLSRDRLLAQLRSEGLKQLGSVKRMYFEANGSFTLVKDPARRSGLCILPDEDEDYTAQQHVLQGVYLCTHCGRNRELLQDKCTNCGNDSFTEAITE